MLNSTQVPNNLLEDIYNGKYSLRETKILLFIARKTIGWQKETEWLQNDYIAKSIGMGKSHVSETVKSLVNKGILEIFEQDGLRYIGLNLFPNREPSVPKSGTTQFPKKEPLKDTRLLKETIIKRGFEKPTIEEIKNYCIERGNSINPEVFYDFYEAKGWKVGNTPMKDWKACVRTWEKRNAKISEVKRPTNVLINKSGVNYAEAWKNKK